MKKATSAKELNAVIVGPRSSHKCLIGNIILGRKVFDAVDAAFDCERGEGVVCERRVTLVKTAGWTRGYYLCDTPQLFKAEAILSVTQCPPGLHAFILVINAELSFKAIYKKAIKNHLHHFFGEKVWDHTVVVFSHRGHKTIEDYIRKEGEPLQSLLKACGDRYHVFCNDGTDNDEKVKQLFEKIDAMVAKNSCYEIENKVIQSVKERRKEVDEKAEELRLQTQQQRQRLRSLPTEQKPNLRILMVGWVFSGKSASANRILRDEVFHFGERTMKVFKQSGKVAGREVVIVDTPGWWKFFPETFTPKDLKSEILNGLSLCSPSPNVILLAVPLDTSFTDEQKRVTENNMKLLGQRVWRHVLVLFTFGDALGDKTIEQHIESEGEPLCWLVEKCGKRYHVLDNWSKNDNQVIELLEKMEGMVAENGSFQLSETDDPQPKEDRGDELTENKDENAIREIREQLLIEWDRRNWEKIHTLKRNASMITAPNFCEDELRSEGSTAEGSGLELESEDDAESGPLSILKRLLEREWSRREASEEYLYRFLCKHNRAISEPVTDELQKSRVKVWLWMKNQHTTSVMEKESGPVLRSRKPRQWSPSGGVAKRRKYSYKNK